jgi:hypothetical protein
MSGLFFPSAPLAVTGLVISVGINAIEGVERALAVSSWRSLSHIGEKGCERVEPSLAYGDPAAAVIVPANVMWVETAPLHLLPTAICWRRFVSWRMSVLGRREALRVSALATTRGGLTASQIGAVNNFLNSTIATTSPKSKPVVRARISQDDQSPKALASDIDACSHGDLLRRLLGQEAVERHQRLAVSLL